MINSQNKGVTIIALIITSMIMLTLAGVTLAVVINGGIFDETKNAAEGTKFKSAEEKVDVMIGEYAMEEDAKGTNIKDFFDSRKTSGRIEKVIEYKTNEYIVIQVDGYTFKINENTLKIEEHSGL